MKRKFMKKAVSLTLVFAMIMAFALPVGAYAPRIGKVVLNQARTTITLNIAENVELNEGVDLASRITIKKDSGTATSLPYGSTAVCDGAVIKINLTTALNSKNTVVTIESGTFIGQTSDMVSPGFDAKGPEAISSVAVDNTKKVVTIKFDSAISSALGTYTLYDGDILLARNGSDFYDALSAKQMELDSSSGTIKITLPTPLTGDYSRFKIPAGTIAYAASGNINLEDIVTPAISAAKVLPKFDPQTGFKMENDFATIKLTFDKDIYFASEEIERRIDEYILISRNNSNFLPLNINDRVSISGKVLTIKLKFPVDTDYNRIKIRENVLMGANGDVVEEEITTNSFGIADIQYDAPMYKSISYDKAKKQVSIKYNATIYPISVTGLKNMIQISRNKGTFQDLSIYDSAEVYGKDTILITLDEGLSGDGNRFRIQPNAIKGDKNNVQTVLQVTGYVDTTADSYEDFEAEFNVSDDMKTVDIVFDRYIESNYPYDTNLDYLKTEITIQRNVGYDALGSNDYISINGRTLRIIFQRAISSTDVIRVGKFALKDTHGAIMANDIRVGVSLSGNKDILDLEDGVTISADKKTVSISFNERVYNNMASVSSLRQMIRVAYNGIDFEELDDDVKFEFESVGMITITFPQTVSNPEARIKILPGALQDSKGSPITDEIVTNPLGRTAESVKVTIGSSRVYIGEEDESTGLDGNRVFTMIINPIKASDAIDTMSYSDTLKVLFPNHAYGAKVRLNCDTVEKLINRNATIIVEADGAAHVFKADEIGLDEALDNLGVDYAEDATVEIGISKVETPYSIDFAQSASDKSYTILTFATEFTITYEGNDSRYAITKYPDYVEKRFNVSPVANQNQLLTVVRIEASGKVNPVPTTKKVAANGQYLSAKVKSNGVYGVIAANRFFTDTPTWAETAVNALASRMILQGASNAPFRAQDAVSRAEVTEMLTRTLGILTDKSGVSNFFDILPSDWYFSSTSIAVENKLINGYGDGTFGPERNITRQEVMTIVARVMEYLGSTANVNMTKAEAESILARFNDGDKVADWAKINMAKCVAAEVVRGDDKLCLNPNANLTRAEMSQLIYNLIVTYGIMG